ncbi:MAG: 30S ribosomal protein S12 methylthiotransferase RimO [Symbiobacteriaceae bacterium]|nr:30S ribosomal protein S12 methylthiotransferase RimO [Symbiobacteriaceae bacterium]
MNYLSFALISLGCAKNLVDAEVMLGYLQEAGHHMVMDLPEAEIILINTCAFIASARSEAIEELLAANRWRSEGKLCYLVATGCLSQRYSQELLQEMPEVDAFLGSSSYPRIREVITRLQQGERSFAIVEEPECFLPQAGMPRQRLTLPATSYLKIADGCDNRCSYCTIPLIRGRFRSRSIEDIHREAEALVATGAREICLVAQDSTRYGMDIYGESRLTELCQSLLTIVELRWLRVLYGHPAHLTRGFLELMAVEERLCSYLDLPLQHSEVRVLAAMNRPVAPGQNLQLLREARHLIPDLMLRSTFIVGFPGESEEEFAALCDFVKQMRFDHLGVFAYEQEEETPAGVLPGQLSTRVKESRRRKLMAVQQGMIESTLSRWLGREVTVLLEARRPDGVMLGRFTGQAPDVDGLVRVSSCDAPPGTFIPARITGVDGYDLLAEAIPYSQS